jgi:2-polyprenyl-3-methyl-5-hydroxy-6-metoxy-1,4-benzoquinol methylase
MLNNYANRRVLDLGCGNGHVVSYLVKQGYDAYGRHVSEKGIAIAKKEYPDRFFRQDLSTNQLPSEIQRLKFDTIISTDAIEYLNPEGFIEICKYILQKNGDLIISIPYHGSWKNLSLAILGKWDSHHDPTWHVGHIKFWSKRTLTKLLTKKNVFTVTGFKGCGQIPYFGNP